MLEERLFPKEVVQDVPRITLIGHEYVQVEQHHGLAVYQPGTILFRTSQGQLRIDGHELRFRRYSASDALVVGEIDAILTEGVGERKAQER